MKDFFRKCDQIRRFLSFKIVAVLSYQFHEHSTLQLEDNRTAQATLY